MKNTLINYVEFKANDLEKVKQFYHRCFGWNFKEYSPNYIAFSESGLEGGFEKTEEEIVNGALIVLYHENLEIIKDKITSLGGSISKNTF